MATVVASVADRSTSAADVTAAIAIGAVEAAAVVVSRGTAAETETEIVGRAENAKAPLHRPRAAGCASRSVIAHHVVAKVRAIVRAARRLADGPPCDTTTAPVVRRPTKGN
jgi:hypothetical protein